MIIPNFVYLNWKTLFSEMYQSETIKFRCVYTEIAVGKPTLIIFSDGCVQTYGTCAYIRWELKDGGFESRLLVAKNRIAPTRQLSIPRFELCGVVLEVETGVPLKRKWNSHLEELCI